MVNHDSNKETNKQKPQNILRWKYFSEGLIYYPLKSMEVFHPIGSDEANSGSELLLALVGMCAVLLILSLGVVCFLFSLTSSTLEILGPCSPRDGSTR